MGKSYRGYHPEQDFLLPPSLREWLPENHLVYFVSDVVDNLNLSALDAVYGDEQRGQPPYDPRMMDQGVGVRVLRGGVQFAAHRAALGRGCGVSGAGGGPRAELPHHRRFPQAAPVYAGRAV